jgi:23S rRNA (pseudouridine1915-N3)-methyltransferase
MIKIIAIGKISSNQSLNDIFQYYLKMINWKIEIVELEVKKKTTPEELKNLEAELIIEKIKPGQISIILEEAGEEYSSPQFAKFLNKLDVTLPPKRYVIIIKIF